MIDDPKLRKLYNLTRLYQIFSIYSYKDEIWKHIPDYPNYNISNYGRVKNIKSKRLLKFSKNDYLDVKISSINLKPKSFKVHRLVAIGFNLENPNNKPTLDHININQYDNRLINLRYATYKEQNNNKHYRLKYTYHSRPIWRIDIESNKKIQLYNSITEATDWIINNTKYNKCSKGDLISVCKKKRNSAYGFKWEYDTSNEDIYKNEEWKNISIDKMKLYYTELSDDYLKYLEKYKISNYGRLKNSNNKICRGSITGRYNCYYINKKHQFKAHRLVAIMFIPNLDIKKFIIVHHKDSNRLNNYVDNLMWVTPSQNTQYSVEDGNMTKNKKSIIQYDLKMNKIEEFESIKEASEKLNILHSNIGACCNEKRLSTQNFIFKFSDKIITNELKQEIIKKVQMNLDHSKKKKVVQYDINMIKIKEFDSVSEASRKLNILRITINYYIKKNNDNIIPSVLYINDNSYIFKSD